MLTWPPARGFRRATPGRRCPQAGSTLPVYDTDGEILFRQEAYFHYLFGVNGELLRTQAAAGVRGDAQAAGLTAGRSRGACE